MKAVKSNRAAYKYAKSQLVQSSNRDERAMRFAEWFSESLYAGYTTTPGLRTAWREWERQLVRVILTKGL